MNITHLGCKEMTQDEYLKLLENNPELKEKFKEIGISSVENELVIELNYYNLLTQEEKRLTSELSPQLANNKNYFIKFGDQAGSYRICFSEAVCDYCYNSLIKARKENYYKQ